jgi:acyl-CoA thioesterase I
MGKRWGTIALGVLAVLAVSLVVYLVTRRSPVRGAGTTPGYVPVSAAPSGPIAAVDLHVTLPAGPVTALVFGDSYVAGTGADPGGRAFTQQAMTQLGWSATYNAVVGSGYCTTHQIDYRQRLAVLPKAPAPAVLLLEGGVNDVGCGPVILDQEIPAALTAIRAAYPHTLIVMLGPAVPATRSLTQLTPVDAALEAAATAARVPYISPLQEAWLTDANRSQYLISDGLHPNQAGYNYLAGLLVKDLRRITSAPSP